MKLDSFKKGYDKSTKVFLMLITIVALFIISIALYQVLKRPIFLHGTFDLDNYKDKLISNQVLYLENKPLVNESQISKLIIEKLEKNPGNIDKNVYCNDTEILNYYNAMMSYDDLKQIGGCGYEYRE